MCNAKCSCCCCSLCQGRSQETHKASLALGQEKAGTRQVPDRGVGIPGFDRVKSLAEKLSANAGSLTYHVTVLEPKTQQGEYRVAEEVWDS